MTTPWGTSITFEVSSSAPDADPVWVDLSDRLLHVGHGLNVAEGRQSELSDVEPAAFSVQLRNRDDALTPGNPSSPYVSWWKQGRRCRFREIVGWLGFDLFDGYLEIPENTVRTQVPGDTDSDILMTVTGLDLVGRHRNGRTFVSTLGEHIIYNGAPSLVAYWPMNEADGPDVTPAIGAPWTVSEANQLNHWSYAPPGPATITYGGQGIPAADDISSITFAPTTITTPLVDYVSSIMLTGVRPTDLTLGVGQAITVVCWTRPGELLAGATAFTLIECNYRSGLTFNAAGIFVNTSGNLVAYSNSSDWGGTVVGPPAPINHPMPVAVRVGFSPPVMELWVRGEVYSDTMVVTTPNPATFNNLDIADRYPGSVGHAQVYLGDPSAWTRDDFVAQYEMGLYGLERQSTGERVATVADYAGIPASQRDIDPGESLMQAASLAGKTAAQAWDEARDTEQGRLFAHAGRLVFHGRRRIYDV